MVIPQKGKRISKIDTYLNCARNIIQAGINNVILRTGEGENNYIIVPASELEWYQKPQN